MVHSKNMGRLCWFFVLAVVIASSCARPHKCEQRERSLADLDLAEDALNRAKLLIPNCEDEKGFSNSSECSRKDKSLGIIQVALNLISDAKKSLPFCNKEPKTNVTTVEPLTNGTTVEPLTNATMVEPLTNGTTVEPLTNATMVEPLTNATMIEPLTNGTTVEPLTNATMVEPLTNGTTVEPLTNATMVEPLTNGTTVEPLTNATIVELELTTEDFRPMDCQDLLAAGHVTSGVYSVWLRGGKSAVRVRCDMDTDGGGWTVIQRRGNFGRQEDFNRNWQDYKHGFGSVERDFWLGNDNIFALSNQGNYSLRMDMTAADSAYALYREFRIEDENANYRLHLGGYSGTAGSSMGNFNFEMFSTKDRNNTKVDSVNCAEVRKGGFWYYYCDVGTDCNPNGLYNPGVEDETSMYYWGFKGFAGLTSFDMKLRRRG